MDADPACRQVLALLLEELGFAADHTASAAEALNASRAGDYVAILLDPSGLDGYEEALEAWAEREGGPPILLCTGLPTEPKLAPPFAGRAAKPVGLRALERALDSVLGE
ncbi:MAG: response regulator [Planctomycetota bacterium]